MGGGGLWKRENTAKGGDHFNVSVDDLIVMKVSEPLEDLFGVEDDGCFIVFQRTPLGAQQRGQTSYKQNTCQPSKGFILKSAILTLNKQKNLFCNGKLSQGGGFELIFGAYPTTVPLSQRISFFSLMSWTGCRNLPLSADVTQSHLHNLSTGTPTSSTFK